MAIFKYRLNAWRTLSLMALAGAALGLAGCGGSTGSPDDTAARGSGTVGILLTDAPAEPGLFEAINVTIEAIHLLGEDGKVEVFAGPPETHDLLDLTHESVPFGFHDAIPAGEYCKIRLTLSDLELVLADDTPDDASDNETFHPRLPGNGKLDLVARRCFDVEPGQVRTLQIDMDAGKSIHVVRNKKNRFNFRPVVFVDVVDGEFPARLLRLEGSIARVDAAAGTLLLCDALPDARGEAGKCAELSFGDDAAFFDNETQGGAPRPLGELLSEEHLGKIPDGQLPPAGKCRLWEIDLDPGQQPAPIDCDDLPVPLPAGTVLVTADGVQRDPWLPLLVLDVLAAELGEFLQVDGSVLSDAEVDADQPLPVMLQAGGVDFNGTRIVSRDGELLDHTALTASQGVQVDGVLELPSAMNPLLKAAIVIVNPADHDDAEQVTGVVLSMEDGLVVIDPDADTVCGQATEIAPGGLPVVGQPVGVSGQCEAGAFVVDNLVVVDDQRT